MNGQGVNKGVRQSCGKPASPSIGRFVDTTTGGRGINCLGVRGMDNEKEDAFIGQPCVDGRPEHPPIHTFEYTVVCPGVEGLGL